MELRIQVTGSQAHLEQRVAPGISLSCWQSAEAGRVYKEVWFPGAFGCLLSEDQHLQLVL